MNVLAGWEYKQTAINVRPVLKDARVCGGLMISHRKFSVFLGLRLDFLHFGVYLLTNPSQQCEVCWEKIITFFGTGYFANTCSQKGHSLAGKKLSPGGVEGLGGQEGLGSFYPPVMGLKALIQSYYSMFFYIEHG